jgi:hypothetical protein
MISRMAPRVHRTSFVSAVRRDIGLRNDRLQPVGFELTLAKGSREEPAAVLAPFQLQDVGTFQLGFDENHRTSVNLVAKGVAKSKRLARESLVRQDSLMCQIDRPWTLVF